MVKNLTFFHNRYKKFDVVDDLYTSQPHSQKQATTNNGLQLQLLSPHGYQEEGAGGEEARTD